MNPKLIKILVVVLLIITIAGAVTLYFLLDSTSNEGEAMSIDDVVKNSYTTEEIRTDLNDGNFVLIQFQFITNSNAALEEIEKREFQVKNEFIKLSVDLTAKDFQDNLSELESDMKTAMNKHMTEGQIVDVLIISKVIQ
ncbi:flagellar basal body-associated FliL family protein [Gracilibacillus thailandensis]|jgi:flagellar protein FliL|uniref:Flagellar basal body-associated protein FliL n=1 Tax=Gracilibacillus thailandensis TaxID=563735 RepID=A0A6N7QZX2_9BACI|nr:flagellar basal body-associated FliL family protein [Gracilibacillus thailandensis]MRI65459.1 flagellar basal body-associated protein FliL [Gracilibacillus thailandensis]